MTVIIDGVSHTPADMVWIAPTLLSSWLIFGSDWEDPAYAKDSQNIVHLRGLVRNGIIGVTVFLLPAGYRPNKKLIFAVKDSTLVGGVDVLSSGEVRFRTGTASNWVSLSGISFAAA